MSSISKPIWLVIMAMLISAPASAEELFAGMVKPGDTGVWYQQRVSTSPTSTYAIGPVTVCDGISIWVEQDGHAAGMSERWQCGFDMALGHTHSNIDRYSNIICAAKTTYPWNPQKCGISCSIADC